MLFKEFQRSKKKDGNIKIKNFSNNRNIGTNPCQGVRFPWHSFWLLKWILQLFLANLPNQTDHPIHCTCTKVPHYIIKLSIFASDSLYRIQEVTLT